ncbi:hypothetical protein EDM80_13540 [bacterium]|nr:MAG: hypothetical protein EDM80_13540 [bacterium]RIK61132.1 MAG: hypothetical protein DCC64_13535 [Planctomycetota bacterium]
MARFRFRLEALLRLRRQAEDLKLKALAESRELLRQHRTDLEAVRTEHSSALLDLARARLGPVNAFRARLLHRHVGCLSASCRAQAAQVEAQGAEVERRLAQAVEAARERRLLEKLRERRLAEAARQAQAQEAALMDEIAQGRRRNS